MENESGQGRKQRKTEDTPEDRIRRKRAEDVPEGKIRRRRMEDVPEGRVRRRRTEDMLEGKIRRKRAEDVPEGRIRRRRTEDVPEGRVRQKRTEDIPEGKVKQLRIKGMPEDRGELPKIGGTPEDGEKQYKKDASEDTAKQQITENISADKIKRYREKDTLENRKRQNQISLRERRRWRRRMLKIRRAVVLGILLAVLVLIISLIVVSCRYIMKQHREPDEESVKLLNEYYAEFIKDTKQEKEKTKKKGEKDFSAWLLESCGEEAWEKITGKLKKSALKDEDFYKITGRTLHVLSDTYKGWLTDDKTAAKHHIYLRDGQEGSPAGLLFAGDVCLEEQDFVLSHYDEVQDLEKCISPEILERTNQADVFLLNHEYCISDRGEPLEGKYYTFRAKPKRMKLIEEMGTDIVSLANNHVYDYGPDALLDTVDLLDKAGISYVGGGRNLNEAKQPVYFVVNGIKVGYTAASRAEKTRYTPQAEKDEPGVLLMYESDEFAEVIQAASSECDYLIAYVHWGTEDSDRFEDYQHEQAEELLKCGADIIIGGHPHVLQGMEYIDGKPVIYSMGDFWFNEETKYNGLLELKVTGEGLGEMSFVPCRQSEYTTRYLSEKAEQRELYDYLEELSKGVKIGDNGVIQEVFTEDGRTDQDSGSDQDSNAD